MNNFSKFFKAIFQLGQEKNKHTWRRRLYHYNWMERGWKENKCFFFSKFTCFKIFTWKHIAWQGDTSAHGKIDVCGNNSLSHVVEKKPKAAHKNSIFCIHSRISGILVYNSV